MVQVGPNNLRFAFDTEEQIYALSEANAATLKVQGKKLKPTSMKSSHCNICRKPKDAFKGKKVAQCDFCATFGCTECIFKTFPFPQIDQHEQVQNFGVICMVCETKLHINTVTSDILRALSKNELRVEARERRIQQVQIEQSEASNRVAIERRKLNEVNAENKLKTDNMIFKTQQQETKIRKCDEDNAQIQRHIDLRRMEKENKDALIAQLKREIEVK